MQEKYLNNIDSSIGKLTSEINLLNNSPFTLRSYGCDTPHNFLFYI